MADPILGNATKLGVGEGADATVFEPICVFGGEALVDFGTYSTNKEYCLAKAEPYVALDDLEFASQTYSYLWSEGSGDAADVIIQAAHLATNLDSKTISVQTEANNSGGTTGTIYTANFLVTGYKHTFTKGAVNKTEFTIEQLSVPVEAVATP